MPIYKQRGNILISIKEKPTDLEKTTQHIMENNLQEIFGLDFVCTEFPLNNFRIDTLAFDAETKSFVIIEYKRDRSFSVIDQGYAYLALLLNNKADFVLAYNEKNNKSLAKSDIDWSQSKVIFIASSFTRYQQEAIGFQNLPIELWEFKKYDENLVSFNEIRASEKNENIATITKNKDFEKISKEIKHYSLEDHFKPNWETSSQLFENFSQRVLEIDSRFEIHPVKTYIGFNISKRNIIAIHTRASKLMLVLCRVKPKDLKDPEKRTRYWKNSFKYYNQHLTMFDIENEEDIDYSISLVKQVYKRFTE